MDNRAGSGGRQAGMRQHLDLEALSALVDDRLGGEERAVAAAHLETCGDCRRELGELRATVELLRGLPHYSPRRSFQLGPRFAADRGGWLARLLPALPALRAATVAVAVLLVAVTAGDIVSNQTEDASDRPGSQLRAVNAPTVDAIQAQEVDGAVSGMGTETTRATSDDVADMPAAAPVAPTTGGDLGATGEVADEAVSAEEDQEAATLAEAPPAPMAGAANAADADTAGGTAFGGGAEDTFEPMEAMEAADSGGDGGAARSQTVAQSVALSPPAATPTATATRTATVTPVAAAPPAEGGGEADDGADVRTRPSTWRLAEVGLGLLLLWLLVSLVGLQRLQRRSGPPT